MHVCDAIDAYDVIDACMYNIYSRIVEFLPYFNGDNHLDYLCCKYDLSYHEIISYPGIHLIYK